MVVLDYSIVFVKKKFLELSQSLAKKKLYRQTSPTGVGIRKSNSSGQSMTKTPVLTRDICNSVENLELT